MMKKNMTTHEGQLTALRRIEGQLRGVQGMIKDGRYCVEILTQLHSVIGAMKRVETEVFKKHLEGCVAGAIHERSPREVRRKVDEVVELLERFNKR
jgi:CsoR family transcriptional regulator, copper-sensing transcriptional repressor